MGGSMKRITSEVETLFRSKVDRRSSDECWPWKGDLDRHGYGEFRKRYGADAAGQACDRWSAHRLAYELDLGPIPDGLVIDHLCRNRACVNPAHMEPVSNAENVRRGEAGTARRSATSCRNGHPYEPGSYRVHGRGPWRVCLICERARHARSNAKRVA